MASHDEQARAPSEGVGAYDRTASGGSQVPPRPPPDPSASGSGQVPTRIGRFTIIRRIGAGGMGEVFAAFDEQLDRKVAVKVLHRNEEHGAGQAARLFREAQAMARLSHPNVVTVHEIGTHGDQTYVAMEFVEGQTLEAWLLSSSRDWRAIVGVFVGAGRGLQAAHEAGLIHRDFKPSNVMVGRDGRVRVLDFGIAGRGREATRQELPGDSLAGAGSVTASALDLRLTAEGSLLGTPAYMSPEQLVGTRVTAASDQFNFCVALYESLFAYHPFLDEPFTWEGLRKQVVRGSLRDPPRMHGVPGWLLAVLRRGLSPRPEARYGSMAELMAALEHDPSRRWRRFVAPVAFAAGAVIAGLTARSFAQREVNACDSGRAIMAAVWNEGRRAELDAAARATGLVWAETVITGVTRDLDGFAGAWTRAHQDACAAHRDGAQSAAMLDARMSCLDRRRLAFANAIELLARPDAAILEGAVKLVQQVPRVSQCNDLTTLASESPPPDDPAIAAEIQAQRLRLDNAAALAAIGREVESEAIADAIIEEAGKLGYRPLEAEALLARARFMLDFGASGDAVLPALNEALVAAVGAGDDAEAGEALARRAYVVGVYAGKIADARVDAALAREFLARVAAPGPLLGLVANNVGAVEVAAGDPAAAEAHFEEAVRIFEALQESESLDLSFALANLAMQTRDAARRDALLQRMVELRRDRLGATHPLTAHGEILWGLYTLDPSRAAERIDRGCDALDAHPRVDAFERRQCRIYLGHARAEIDPAAGAEELRRALGLAIPGLDDSPEGRRGRAVEDAYVRLYTGEAAAALDETRRELSDMPEETGGMWWQRLERAETQLALALNLEAAHADAEAVALFDRVIPAFEGLARQRLEVGLGQRLAAARVARARARGRVAAAEDVEARADAAADLAAAEAWYRGAGPGYARRLAELEVARRALG